MEQHTIKKREVLISSFDKAIHRLDENLSATGHSHRVVEDYVRIIKHFCCWYAHFAELGEVRETTIKEFYDHFGSCTCNVPGKGSYRMCRAAFNNFLHILREMDLAPPVCKPILPEDNILQMFQKHLTKVCGITDTSASVYIRHLRPFLQNIYTGEIFPFNSLTAKDVEMYIVCIAPLYKPKTIKLYCTSLRAFFRFLKLLGKIDRPLEDAVPTVPDWSLSSIPKYLEEQQISVFLSSFDMHTIFGIRNRAMAMLMAEMGLRAGEVANLKFRDINWQQSSIKIYNTKSRRIDHLPLTIKTGEALVTYLKKRPQTQARHVFISLATPVGRPLTASAVRIAMRRTFKRCYPEKSAFGSHILRHSLATRMLNNGLTFKEIADVLRHRNIETTAIYAKVDLKNLRHATLPWPEVAL